MEIKDTELIELLCEDVQQGMTLLVDRYGGAVKSVCSHILRKCESSLVEDCIQETFVSLWRNLAQEKTYVGNLKAYVYQCARNQAISQLKKYRKESGVSFEELQYTGIEELVATEWNITEQQVDSMCSFECVHNTLEEIGEPEKTIFVLRYFYNYTVKEISKHLNFKEDNVESKIRRCKRKLRKKLEERGVFYEE